MHQVKRSVFLGLVDGYEEDADWCDCKCGNDDDGSSGGVGSSVSSGGTAYDDHDGDDHDDDGDDDLTSATTGCSRIEFAVVVRSMQ